MHYILILHPKSASINTEPKPMDSARLKARYIRMLPTAHTDWPKHQVNHYVKLAIVKKESVTQKHEDVIKYTIKGNIDRFLKIKEPLADLRDIFYYENKPCPRLIVIMGGPGEY